MKLHKKHRKTSITLLQWLDNSQTVKIISDAQLLKLEAETPDPEAVDFFGVFPALDACMALSAMWQLMQVKPVKKQKAAEIDIDDIQSISRLSYNSVSYYVELLFPRRVKSVTVTCSILIIYINYSFPVFGTS